MISKNFLQIQKYIQHFQKQQKNSRTKMISKILLFLIEEKILIFDEYIAKKKKITTEKYVKIVQL